MNYFLSVAVCKHDVCSCITWKDCTYRELKLEHIAHETMKNVISDHRIVFDLFLWHVNYISSLLNLVIDPVLEEESYQDGSLKLTCMPSCYEVTQLTMSGEWSTPKINEGIQICLDASAKLATIMRECLKGADSALEE
ncbi:putative exoribonuclease, phosphorolytic domain 2 [Rosa chinensis]|uniref:Putative exoribonuclease, phosphorolytic domain 2 n=1 Tax=Rosa chinensis TaxID=74649 RepID=A0A2P6SD61_ROSCH|nr:putative exoribonuclease, phosphorolytic domain 2 [Rosa chinensis]